eukprot:CAMPEP_0184403430 /NCGR_PEP_ID=MMETSP0007-20130409/85408_1 /TAXON_ID=97485 /ORGANISM="Prymnesium parvum, Strain Texoma1" /LENGTH=93 /DNA_ID=CAMNT_0026759529 /DNA_START=638 /DNA_END=916 /DNA_ORIENTATION=-
MEDARELVVQGADSLLGPEVGGVPPGNISEVEESEDSRTQALRHDYEYAHRAYDDFRDRGERRYHLAAFFSNQILGAGDHRPSNEAWEHFQLW